MNPIGHDAGDLAVQQVSRRTGPAQSALRYYERIGLIDPVPRDESSGHRQTCSPRWKESLPRLRTASD